MTAQFEFFDGPDALQPAPTLPEGVRYHPELIGAADEALLRAALRLPAEWPRAVDVGAQHSAGKRAPLLNHVPHPARGLRGAQPPCELPFQIITGLLNRLPHHLT